jgi:hypothetical protein
LLGIYRARCFTNIAERSFVQQYQALQSKVQVMDEVLYARTSREQKEALDRAALAERRSPSNLLRLFVDEGLARRGYEIDQSSRPRGQSRRARGLSGNP